MQKYYLVCWLFLSSLNSITKPSRDNRGDPWLRHRRGWRRQAGTGRAGGNSVVGFFTCCLLHLDKVKRGWVLECSSRGLLKICECCCNWKGSWNRVRIKTVPLVIANSPQVLGMPLVGFGACGVGGIKTVKWEAVYTGNEWVWMFLSCRSLVML